MTGLLGVLEGRAYDTNFGKKFWVSRARLPHVCLSEMAENDTPSAQCLIGNISNPRFFGINSVPFHNNQCSHINSLSEIGFATGNLPPRWKSTAVPAKSKMKFESGRKVK